MTSIRTSSILSVTCASCGAPLAHMARYCGYCGAQRSINNRYIVEGKIGEGGFAYGSS